MDIDRLTEYGFGYLIGKIMLLCLFLTVIYFTKNNKVEKKKAE